jgi:hypothetical protein
MSVRDLTARGPAKNIFRALVAPPKSLACLAKGSLDFTFFRNKSRAKLYPAFIVR